MLRPSKEQALQFALMLQSGMPSEDAIRYFVVEEMGASDLAALHKGWMGSKELSAAILHLQGKPWQEMVLEQRIRFAIDKHYSEMAYFLYSNNYATLDGSRKQKADTCRQALEAKLAGMAGKMDALTRFWDDVVTGKLALKAAPMPLAIA